MVFQKNSDGTWDDGYAVIELEAVDSDVIFEYKENAEVVTVTDPDPAVPAGEPQDKAPSVDYTIKITEVSIVGWKDSADPVESEESDRVYDIALWKASDLEDDSAKFTFDYGFTEAVNPSQGPTMFLFASLEANDPRCNHRTAGWAWVKKRVTGAPEFFVSEASEDVEDFSDSDFHTLGKDNKNFKPGSPDEYYGTDGIMDKEKDSTKIYEISTAFIRNAPDLMDAIQAAEDANAAQISAFLEFGHKMDQRSEFFPVDIGIDSLFYLNGNISHTAPCL